MMRGLEIGVNDYLMRPIDKNELLARVRTPDPQEALHRAAARQRAAVDRDGDHRRRSPASTTAATWKAISATLVEQAAARGKPLTVLVLDIDYFKSINDTHGHDAGDDVLREFAIRIKKSIRGIDLACRYGGEEFVIVMPETDMAVATMVAERLRRRIAAEPFAIAAGRASTSRSRSRSASPRSTPPTTTPPRSSSAPTRRSIAPSATAATASSPTRRNFHFADDRPAFACRARGDALASHRPHVLVSCRCVSDATAGSFQSRAADLWRKFSWAAPLQ